MPRARVCVRVCECVSVNKGAKRVCWSVVLCRGGRVGFAIEIEDVWVYE